MYENVQKDKNNLIPLSIKNSKFYDEANKEVIGKMKDKTENVLIFGFVGLKPKMYSNIEEDDFRKKIQKKLIES